MFRGIEHIIFVRRRRLLLYLLLSRLCGYGYGKESSSDDDDGDEGTIPCGEDVRPRGTSYLTSGLIFYL